MDGLVPSPLTRLARFLWIAGGAIALAAAIALIAGVEARAWRLAPRPVVMSLFRSHDGLIALQALLMLGAAALLRHTNRELLAGTALLGMFVLPIVDNAGGTLYMIPQGLLGIWVISVSVRHRATISRSTLVLGLVAGIGLVMIAVSFLIMLAYFGPSLLTGPIRDQSAAAQAVNRTSHYLLRVATYPGRLGFPIWVFVMARHLSEAPADQARK